MSKAPLPTDLSPAHRRLITALAEIAAAEFVREVAERADKISPPTPSKPAHISKPFEPPSETLLALADVKRRTAKSTASIYREMQDGLFPLPLKRGRRSVWVASEVQAVIEREIATLPRMGLQRGARPKRKSDRRP